MVPNDGKPMRKTPARRRTVSNNCTLFLLILLLSFALAAPVVATPTATVVAASSSGGWLPMRTAVAPAGQTGQRFLGPFERQAVTLLVTELPAHTQITLRFDFYAIATWDGNAEGDIGPDIFSVTHSGDQPLLQTTFSHYAEHPQAYPGAYPGASNPAYTGAAAVGSLGYNLDSVYNFSFTFAHTDAVLQVQFAGVGLQGDGDEAWGLDNVVVEADGQVVYTFDAESDTTGPVVEVAQLLAADRQTDDTLGTAVAVHEDLLAAGAPVTLMADNLLNQYPGAGAVYLFTRNAAGLYEWNQSQKLMPADGAPQDHFGWSVALDATLIAVGAPWADIDGNRDQGAVYLFARSPADPNRWAQIQKLVAPDGAADDRFGRALALNGGGMVIGANEKAYVFYRRGDEQWDLVKTLTASDGRAGDRFGDSVALDSGIILVGASGAPIGANYLLGAAYLYQQHQGGANNWGEVKKLTAPDGDVLTFFGHPVLLANNQAIIGSAGKQQVYLFSRNFGGLDTWAEVQRLTSMDGQANYSFGSRLAVHNQRLLVGGSNQGELFERADGDELWLPLRKLQGSAGSRVDFAGSFALLDHLAFVGTPSASSPAQSWHGAVYLFDVTRPTAPTVRFAQSDYPVQENVDLAVLKVLLDQPSPYPLTIAYETSSIEQEALPVEDYRPVSGTLTIVTGATEGVINVPIINDDRLELTERLYINLGSVGGGLLADPRWATVTIRDDDTVGVCDYVAHDEVSLDRAIRCLYVADSGPVTIQVTDNISLTRALPTITSPQVAAVIIEGNGHTIDAQGYGRALSMYKIKVDLRNLTLRGGRVPLVQDWPPNYGGAIYADTPSNGFAIEQSCALTLTNVILTDNEAYAGGGLYYGCELPLQMTDSTVSNNRAVVGGAFSTSGGEEFFTELFINRSTFSGNVAQANGGAFDLSSGDGGVILELVNSTVSSNRVISGTGGGLWITQASHDGRSETHLINSTVANNEANQGSGIFNRYGILRMSNTLIADNRGSSHCIYFTSEDGNGQIISHGYNLDSDASCLPDGVRQPSDRPNGNANLGPLADNGGATLTHALLPGSQALDAGDDAICTAELVNSIDQRSVPRFQGPHCDLGAYEFIPPAPANTLRIQALIDGRSRLIVRSNTVQWHHLDWAAPGRHLFANNATIINDALWFPVWPDIPDAENRFCNCNSDIFTSTEPFLPADSSAIGLRLLRSRASVQIVQLPTASNDYTLIVEFDDYWSGSDIYIIDLTWGQPQALLFVSSSSSGRAGEVQFRDEDIIAYDFTSNGWQMLFDGSDVGVTKDVDAFAFRPDGSLLLSFNAPTDVPGLGLVDDADIVQFSPTTLGSTTAGSFALYLRGTAVDLTTDGEDIDAIGFTTDGKLVVSTIGDFAVANLSGKDEDLIRLDDKTTGAWSLFFDGSAVGLANEDVNGLWIDPTTSELYLTVKDSFAFGAGQDGVQIDSDDIFVCTPGNSSGGMTCAYRLFWDSDAHDYGSENLDSIGLGTLPIVTSASAPSDEEALPPEDALPDTDADDLDLEEVDLEEVRHTIFLPIGSK